MAKPKKSADAKARSDPAMALADIMGHFCEARSLVVVCQRSLESVELGDESEALLVALELLRRTYNELDAFASQYSKSSRGV